MDINYLLKREQISLMRAGRAACAEARIVHEGLAEGYAALLRRRGYPHVGVAIIRTALPGVLADAPVPGQHQ